MTALADVRTSVNARVGFAFSPDGSRGASLAVAGDEVVLETWTVGERGVVPDAAAQVDVDPAAVLQPLDDGSVLLACKQPARPGLQVALLRVRPEAVARFVLADMDVLAGYFVPSTRQGEVGVLVTVDDAQWSTIWRLPDHAEVPEPVLRLPGVVSGGTWLDPDTRLLALNLAEGGGPVKGIAVDVRSGAWRRIWSVAPGSSDRILLCAPAAGLLVVSSTVSGHDRIGVARGGTNTVDFPTALYRPGHPRRALAVDEQGTKILVHEAAGAVSRLWVHHVADGTMTAVVTPAGVLTPPASWSDTRVTVPFSRPDLPARLVSLSLHDAAAGTRVEAPSPGPWADAELTWVDGATGPMEAIVYGGSDWLTKERLVVGLHGGPLSASRFEFDPRWQSLVQADIAVVAPNYRGSVGYGEEHMNAVLGDWGGPDLADVCALGRRLAEFRRGRGLSPPIVLGGSYGGFLALLAACTAPSAWSGCIALAPFLSGQALHDVAGDPVRKRITALGGLGGTSTPGRDVLDVCRFLAVPLLLAHGTADERVPVGQSRELAGHLRRLGLGSATDPRFEHVEIHTDHSGVVRDWPAQLASRIARFCDSAGAELRGATRP